MQAHPQSSSAARNLNPSRTQPSIAEGPGLAHDTGNLLGALGLYCDLLDLPGVLRPEHLHYARELRLLSQRSGALIHRLLEGDATPVGTSARPPPKRLCPASVVRAFTPVLRSMAAPEATVSMAMAGGLPQLPFEAEVLERILVNLTRNAANALLSQGACDIGGRAIGGKIHIGLCGDQKHLSLTVMDNGPGMPDKAAAAFLKPGPLPRGALSGLGHHVIHDLVKSTGGELSIVVIPGRGTTVQIDWPIATVKATGERLAAAPRRTPRAGSDRTLKFSPQTLAASPRKGLKLPC